jgi:hypothetical protein
MKTIKFKVVKEVTLVVKDDWEFEDLQQLAEDVCDSNRDLHDWELDFEDESIDSQLIDIKIVSSK